MTRVAYNLDVWQHAPTRLRVDGHSIHLDGFHNHHPLLLSLADTSAMERMDLLVVPPKTPPGAAEQALASAGAYDLRRPAELLLALH